MASWSLATIPQEILQNIAANLEDQDLVNLRAACKSTLFAIDARPAHFWMYRYKEHFDLPQHPCSLDSLRDLYQERRKVLRHIPIFKHGKSDVESECIKHLLEIALDANPKAIANGIPDSKNFDLLDHIIKNSNLLQCIFAQGSFTTPGIPTHSRKTKTIVQRRTMPMKDSPSALQVLQLLLSSRSLSFIVPEPSILSFEDSQRAAYMDTERMPMFGGQGGMEVNIVWALHIVNFFRYHMLHKSGATLFPAYTDLSMLKGEVPQLWKKNLSNNSGIVPLGRHWKGSYAYLAPHEVNEIRRGTNAGSRVYEDHNVDLGHKAIQELEVIHPVPVQERVWPSTFEHHLQGQSFLATAAQLQEQLYGRRVTRSNQRLIGPERPEELQSHYYSVRGWDDETFWASGWISQLPTQRCIPGFKRMVMMKYFTDSVGNIDYDALWAYEGIVLPGDQVIVGRWWSPEDPIVPSKIYSGPFILWNTDCAKRDSIMRERSL